MFEMLLVFVLFGGLFSLLGYFVLRRKGLDK